MVKQDHVTGLHTFWWNGEIKGQGIPEDKDFVNVPGGGGRELQYRKAVLKETPIPTAFGENRDEYDMFDRNRQAYAPFWCGL